MLLYCVCLALPFVSSDGLRPQPHGTVMYREECREDAECSTGKVCMAGKCGEEINVIDSGEKCNLSKDQCAPGFCCFKNQTLMFPVCVPLPVEGQQCRNQPSLLNLLKINAVTECESCNCPCAEGLVCTSRGHTVHPMGAYSARVHPPIGSAYPGFSSIKKIQGSY
ncbi:hypothetical protein GDO86_016155 [Hymenochirus boettgeri]|uniref:Uncharacterized protein n=1 Tax=Hymenochirus boettgeri TaxID=247094 RepID=A0A8T2JVW4_9PIPI|nr:hypothetical protein GDO86_016155 [Hymenochirus boettgeri]